MDYFIPQKDKSTKELISLRIDPVVLQSLDEIACDTRISRNELINQCITYALKMYSRENKITNID